MERNGGPGSRPHDAGRDSRICCASVYLLRLPEIPISKDAIPPPEIRSEKDMASRANGYSIPLGAKKAGQCTPKIAVIMVQATKKAPTRVSSPSTIRIPPPNSDRAAAPHHSQAGRMKENG